MIVGRTRGSEYGVGDVASIEEAPSFTGIVVFSKGK